MASSKWPGVPTELIAKLVVNSVVCFSVNNSYTCFARLYWELKSFFPYKSCNAFEYFSKLGEDEKIDGCKKGNPYRLNNILTLFFFRSSINCVSSECPPV